MMSIFEVILKLIFLDTFWCVGVYMNSEKGDIFYFLTQATEGAPPWIAKPVIRCINCMAGFHGLIIIGIYHLLIGLPELLWFQYVLLWVVVAILTSGIGGIVWVGYAVLHELHGRMEDRE